MAQRGLMGGLSPFRPGISRAARWVAFLLCLLVFAVLLQFVPPGSHLTAPSRAVLGHALHGYLLGFCSVFVISIAAWRLKDEANDWLVFGVWVVVGISYGWTELGGFMGGVLLFAMFELIASSIFGGPSVRE